MNGLICLHLVTAVRMSEPTAKSSNDLNGSACIVL